MSTEPISKIINILEGMGAAVAPIETRVFSQLFGHVETWKCADYHYPDGHAFSIHVTRGDSPGISAPAAHIRTLVFRFTVDELALLYRFHSMIIRDQRKTDKAFKFLRDAVKEGNFYSIMDLFDAATVFNKRLIWMDEAAIPPSSGMNMEATLARRRFICFVGGILLSSGRPRITVKFPCRDFSDAVLAYNGITGAIDHSWETLKDTLPLDVYCDEDALNAARALIANPPRPEILYSSYPLRRTLATIFPDMASLPAGAEAILPTLVAYDEASGRKSNLTEDIAKAVADSV